MCIEAFLVVDFLDCVEGSKYCCGNMLVAPFYQLMRRITE
jgi:hypothetical protein